MRRMALFFQTMRCAAQSLLLLLLLAGASCTDTREMDPEPDPTPAPAPDPDPEEPKESADVAIDRWMYDYMKTHYLWNEAVKQVTPDYTLDYEDFLDDVLEKVAAQNDVNHDDGHWENGKRSYFYSNIQRYNRSTAGIATRGTREMAEGLGFEMLYYASLTQTYYAFIVAAVTPGSPADKAGLKRGDLISRVDGTRIRDPNLNASWTKLMATQSGSVRVTPYDLTTDKDGAEITLTATPYEDTPIWAKKIITTSNGRKVGYLAYGSFNYNYDDRLMEAFGEFRREQIDELVLDLRYNGGGHVVSSAVLATLIAGKTHQGEVYATTTYNSSRKNEAPDTYKLGEAQYSTKYRYDAIAEALSSAIGVERLYLLCTASTASASELVINGLRGLDFEVRLIGETTNGKNVGMEPIVENFGRYQYEFSPITFYIANAKGSRDYGDGFLPDVEAPDQPFFIEESNVYHKIDWGDEENDLLLRCALFWIEEGRKPVITTASTRTFDGLQLHTLRTVRSPRVQEMLQLPMTAAE